MLFSNTLETLWSFFLALLASFDLTLKHIPATHKAIKQLDQSINQSNTVLLVIPANPSAKLIHRITVSGVGYAGEKNHAQGVQEWIWNMIACLRGSDLSNPSQKNLIQPC